MKAKDTILFNNRITQNHILARRAWFWNIASQLMKNSIVYHIPQLFKGFRLNVNYLQITNLLYTFCKLLVIMA